MIRRSARAVFFMQWSSLTDPMIEKEEGDGSFSRSRVTSEILRWIVQANWKVIGPNLLGAACGVVLVGMLAAGL